MLDQAAGGKQSLTAANGTGCRLMILTLTRRSPGWIRLTRRFQAGVALVNDVIPALPMGYA
jgi:hypothetical protein